MLYVTKSAVVFKYSHLTVALNPLSKQLQLVFCPHAKRNEIKSFIFSLYSAEVVWGVCGALKAGGEFKKLLSKLNFQKLNKILISQARFFDYIIIFRSTKMLAQIADLRLCALISWAFCRVSVYMSAYIKRFRPITSDILFPVNAKKKKN